MGAYDVPLLIGAAAVVGYFVLTNPDILSGIFPSAGGGDTGTGTGDGTFEPGTDDSTTPTASSSGSPCGDLCRAKDCSGYKAQCTTGCVHCPNSGKNSPGGGGGSSSGSNCGQLCRDKDCEGYKASCNNGCTYCCDSGPLSPNCDKSANSVSSCGSLCAAHNCTEYYKKCKTGCSNCSVDKSKSSGTSAKCPACQKGFTRGTGCSCKAKPGSSPKKFNDAPTCCQAGSCTNASGSACCAYRGSHGGCASGQKGVSHSGGGCDCVKSGMAYAYMGRMSKHSHGYTAHELAYRVARNNWSRQGISVS